MNYAYYDIFKVLERILSERDRYTGECCCHEGDICLTRLSDMVWKYEESTTISHPCNGKIWQYASSKLREGEKLLMLIYFLDEWKIHTQRNDKVTGIYFGVSNSRKVRQTSVIATYI